MQERAKGLGLLNRALPGNDSDTFNIGPVLMRGVSKPTLGRITRESGWGWERRHTRLRRVSSGTARSMLNVEVSMTPRKVVGVRMCRNGSRRDAEMPLGRGWANECARSSSALWTTPSLGPLYQSMVTGTGRAFRACCTSL